MVDLWNINCKLKKGDRKISFTKNMVTIVEYPNSKTKIHEIEDIQSILGCFRSIPNITKRLIGAKMSHWLSVSTNINVKWSFKFTFISFRKI